MDTKITDAAWALRQPYGFAVEAVRFSDEKRSKLTSVLRDAGFNQGGIDMMIRVAEIGFAHLQYAPAISRSEASKRLRKVESAARAFAEAWTEAGDGLRELLIGDAWRAGKNPELTLLLVLQSAMEEVRKSAADRADKLSATRKNNLGKAVFAQICAAYWWIYSGGKFASVTNNEDCATGNRLTSPFERFVNAAALPHVISKDEMREAISRGRA